MSNGAWVSDATTNDVVTWGDFRLTGGASQWWQEANWAYDAPLTSVLMASPLTALTSGVLLDSELRDSTDTVTADVDAAHTTMPTTWTVGRTTSRGAREMGEV